MESIMAKGSSGMKGVGGKRSGGFTGKSKVISTGTLKPVRGGSNHMFGQQTVKAAKPR
jgi:hypothetical protein